MMTLAVPFGNAIVFHCSRAQKRSSTHHQKAPAPCQAKVPPVTSLQPSAASSLRAWDNSSKAAWSPPACNLFWPRSCGSSASACWAGSSISIKLTTPPATKARASNSPLRTSPHRMSPPTDWSLQRPVRTLTRRRLLKKPANLSKISANCPDSAPTYKSPSHLFAPRSRPMV